MKKLLNILARKLIVAETLAEEGVKIPGPREKIFNATNKINNLLSPIDGVRRSLAERGDQSANELHMVCREIENQLALIRRGLMEI